MKNKKVQYLLKLMAWFAPLWHSFLYVVCKKTPDSLSGRYAVATYREKKGDEEIKTFHLMVEGCLFGGF